MKAHSKICSYCSAALFQDRSWDMPLSMSSFQDSGWLLYVVRARSKASSIAGTSQGLYVQPVPTLPSATKRFVSGDPRLPSSMVTQRVQISLGGCHMLL
jgi:hypothetical protein